MEGSRWDVPRDMNNVSVKREMAGESFVGEYEMQGFNKIMVKREMDGEPVDRKFNMQLYAPLVRKVKVEEPPADSEPGGAAYGQVINQSTEKSLEYDKLECSSNDSQLESSLEAASTSAKRSPAKMKPPAMPARKKKKQSPSPIDESLEKFSKFVDKIQTEDAFDHFGRYVAAELRQLSQRSATELQFEIHKSIMESKLSELREKESS